ncbi:uncharacterized protein PHALS_06014 [Plasmopara halstedii]|uniref:Uncharacterized protein n=1 Tax=Plasmopara halstedii TaxID=4781 RepID=A0A0P1AC23_PLAHL|nr:uncharacterized protein PHALS_06014 [Plasmopara halstedii]CEG37969.1 hypothetical protein PHALS_06014 [Plasmopara halstedii]|eukprot:XP_024574338.1 hypothetical protein PHALS_06014 [Plasmopara halstedii]
MRARRRTPILITFITKAGADLTLRQQFYEVKKKASVTQDGSVECSFTFLSHRFCSKSESFVIKNLPSPLQRKPGLYVAYNIDNYFANEPS